MCDFVSLKGGLVVPVDALQVLLELERAGHKLWPEGDDILIEPGGCAVDPDALARLRRWKRHVRTLLSYTPSDASADTVRQ